MSKINERGRFRLSENAKIQIIGRDGVVKKIFNENKFGAWLLKTVRKYVKDPIDEAGKVKTGILNHLAAYGLQISGLTGSFSDYRLASNLITTVGKALVAGRINGSGTPAAATYIAVGTGTTAANVADTTLETETAASGLTRAAATVSLVTTDTANDTARLIKTFTVTGSVAVTESGVFNDATVGTLLARQVFSAVNVVNGDSLQVTWDFDVD